jgi:hypothetical protein
MTPIRSIMLLTEKVKDGICEIVMGEMAEIWSSDSVPISVFVMPPV